MTPRTTARPTIVRTMLPPPEDWTAFADVSDGRLSLVCSPPAARAAGAGSRQPRRAAATRRRKTWRECIISEGGSPDQAQVPIGRAPPSLEDTRAGGVGPAGRMRAAAPLDVLGLGPLRTPARPATGRIRARWSRRGRWRSGW